jgi:hypothetical protein
MRLPDIASLLSANDLVLSYCIIVTISFKIHSPKKIESRDRDRLFYNTEYLFAISRVSEIIWIQSHVRIQGRKKKNALVKNSLNTQLLHRNGYRNVILNLLLCKFI